MLIYKLVMVFYILWKLHSFLMANGYDCYLFLLMLNFLLIYCFYKLKIIILNITYIIMIAFKVYSNGISADMNDRFQVTISVAEIKWGTKSNRGVQAYTSMSQSITEKLKGNIQGRYWIRNHIEILFAGLLSDLLFVIFLIQSRSSCLWLVLPK